MLCHWILVHNTCHCLQIAGRGQEVWAGAMFITSCLCWWLQEVATFSHINPTASFACFFFFKSLKAKCLSNTDWVRTSSDYLITTWMDSNQTFWFCCQFQCDKDWEVGSKARLNFVGFENCQSCGFVLCSANPCLSGFLETKLTPPNPLIQNCYFWKWVVSAQRIVSALMKILEKNGSFDSHKQSFVEPQSSSLTCTPS